MQSKEATRAFLCVFNTRFETANMVLGLCDEHADSVPGKTIVLALPDGRRSTITNEIDGPPDTGAYCMVCSMRAYLE